ncbi:MAG TPA: hypothetical protein V6D10_21200 [Trichocoleus sp.]|jgi:uncharacterized membrane protein YfhO
MFFLLVIVIGLVAWALHLMQEAVQRREFSLMLAGFLVSSAAAALMSVYFLMGHYFGYMTEMAHRSYLHDSVEWAAFDQSLANLVSSPSSPSLHDGRM